ncbi:unnamed protein product [marine sediment metagenome]
MGRSAAGIRGIRLKRGDEVIGMDIVDVKHQQPQKEYLLVVMKNGFGKRTDLREYRLQGRGGSGIKTAQVTSKTGNLVASKVLTTRALAKGEDEAKASSTTEEDLIVISQKGQVIRAAISGIPKLSRVTQGVRIMRLGEGDQVASATCI